jgi:glycosyltransferase involved in cell wall biosynthesis
LSKNEFSRSDTKLRVVGHPFSPIGMGEHVRCVWRALKEVGLDAGIVDIYGVQHEKDPELVAEMGSAITDDLGAGVNIFCINGDEISPSLTHMNRRNPRADGSFNVIYPAWELERYPTEWANELARCDEVWAPSEFIRSSIEKEVRIPVVPMPLACEVGRRALRSRRHFGIRESAYAFIFAFDFLSYLERKNPFAILEAFVRYLSRHPFDDAVLVFKTNNAQKRPEMKARFDAAIAPFRDRVLVIDDTLSELDMKALLWLCDCFVSLHRSEGYGRGPSEAMALGKPVIVTGYSGNMDFCNDETAFLIPFNLIPVREGEYPHWEGQRWADPDVDVAATLMRRLVSDPELGRAKGAKARARLIADFSYLAVGQSYADRLTSLAKARGPRA